MTCNIMTLRTQIMGKPEPSATNSDRLLTQARQPEDARLP